MGATTRTLYDTDFAEWSSLTADRAVRGALFETGLKTAQLPKRCPFTLDQFLEEFDLNWPS